MRIFGLELVRKGYYEGYDPDVNPTVANAFSTAAYRFGHSLVQHSFVRFDSGHRPILNSRYIRRTNETKILTPLVLSLADVSIHDELANLGDLETAGSVDRLLLGLINQPAQRRDEHISEELTNHLFQTPAFPFGMDLASINIQRGRDHGIPPYVDWRQPCALSPIRNFDDLEKAIPPSTASKFRSVYSSVEDIDLFTGGIAEKSVKGGLVGPTFACIIGQQFNNLRRGDRFWYENSREENGFTAGQLQQIRRVTLSQVLCITMDDIETVQPFVFLTRDALKNQPLPCNDSRLNLESWVERPKSADTFRRRGILDAVKRRITTPPPPENVAPSTTSRTAAHNNLNPPRASVHQQNRIVVKRPLHPSDNLTIVVQNNAINSPVFVNDAIYGSDIRVNPSLNQHAQHKETDVPHVGLLHIPVHAPPPKPIPTVHPLGNVHRPYADPNNPNPWRNGYRPTYPSEDVVFDSFPATSPRPTLYTYYTNFVKTRNPAENDPKSNPNGSQQSSVQTVPPDIWHKLHYYQSSPSPFTRKNGPYPTANSGQKDTENRYTTSWSPTVPSDHPTSHHSTPYRTGSNERTPIHERIDDRVQVAGWSSNERGSDPNDSSDYSTPLFDGGTGFYQIFATRPKVHGATIVTEAAVGYKIEDKTDEDDRVTGEIPKPLPVRSDKKEGEARKPGQYYYERNALHRYPDRGETSNGGGTPIDDRGAVIGASVRNEEIVDGNANDTVGTMNQTRNDDRVTADDVDPGEEIETVASSYYR